MPQQSAYSVDSPNGSARRALNDRVTAIFRLYRKTPAPLPTLVGDSFLTTVRNDITAVRSAVRFVTQLISPASGPLAGRQLVKEYRFVLILEALQDVPDVRSRVSYEQLGYFIDSIPGDAKGLTHFRMRGLTHWQSVWVNGVAVDGAAGLKDFRETIADYLFPPDGSNCADHELYWLNLNALPSAEDPFGEFEWLIHPVRGVQTSQHARRPNLWNFEFDFLGLQSNRDRAKSEDGFLAGLLSRGYLKTLLDALGLGALSDALDGIFGILTDVRGLFDDLNNLVTVVTDYIAGVNAFVIASVAKVRAILTGVQELIGRVENGIELAENIPDLTDEQLQLLRQDWPGLTDGDVTEGIIAADELARVRDFLLLLSAQPASFAPSLNSAVQPQQSTAQRITPGTTIEDIARDAQIDVDTLITLNGLQFPFVDARPRPDRQMAAAEATRDGAIADRQTAQAAIDTLLQGGASPSSPDVLSLQTQITRATTRIATAETEIATWQAAPAAAAQGVLYAGDEIRIPRPRPDVVPSVKDLDPTTSARITALTGQAPNEEDRLFGVDLALTDDGDLVWDAEKRDLMLERGLTHMGNVLVRYAKLPFGQLRYAPNVGNYAFADLNRWQGPGTNRLLAYDWHLTFLQDPRTKRIRNITAVTHRGAAHISPDIELINGKSLPEIRVPVP